ncbi:MAG: hypothetical protein JF591_08550 [Lysobacter sp.]|nr:hypothetical protein [Lysobacter sp.]
MPASFLFYDLETYGSDPRTTRIAQFAAIRTDADLNQIDTPISVFVKPADDLLPSPIATVITGIAPQDALRDGVSEAEIFALIFEEMARPETCSAGYNSLRFDDEFVRYGLFRNFYDPYEREWRSGNSRWDLLDVIAMTPALHVSQRYPAARLCAAPVIPLARHPRIDNRVLVFDLAQDPAALLRLAPDEIADRLYTPTADLPQGEERIALKEVHLNRCPALIAWNHLRPADFERLQIDPAQVERHAAQIREAGPELVEKVRRVYANDRARDPSDVDASLYDAFIGDGDKRLLRNVRTTAPEALAQAAFEFRDARLPELLFRYRARNWPQTLSAGERERWDAYRRHRLVDDSGLSEFNFERFAIELQQARAMVGEDGAKQALLDRLHDWAGTIARDLNASG